jgi:hypothetical protein
MIYTYNQNIKNYICFNFIILFITTLIGIINTFSLYDKNILLHFSNKNKNNDNYHMNFDKCGKNNSMSFAYIDEIKTLEEEKIFDMISNGKNITFDNFINNPIEFIKNVYDYICCNFYRFYLYKMSLLIAPLIISIFTYFCYKIYLLKLKIVKLNDLINLSFIFISVCVFIYLKYNLKKPVIYRTGEMRLEPNNFIYYVKDL